MRILNNSGMQENEFEKQVKHLMEDLNLPAPGDAWEKISRKLEEKRRRKTPFFFLLLAIGLLTAGFFIFQASEKHVQDSNNLSNNKASTVIITDSSTQKNSGSLIVKKDDSSNNKQALLLNKPNGAFMKSAGEKYQSLKFSATTTINNKRSHTINGDTINKLHNVIHTDLPQLTFQSIKATDSINVNNELFKKDVITTDASKTTAEIIQPVVKDSNVVNADLIKQDSVATAQNKTINITNQSTKKVAAHNNKTLNWQWGVNAFYGKSNAVDGINIYNGAAGNINDPGTVANGDTAFYNAHAYTASNAYRFGFEVQKKIFKNGFLSTGLNFIHLSTKSGISKKVDSSYSVTAYANTGTNSYTVNRYYQPGDSSTYANRYNFIELPVYFQQDFLKGTQYSFSYNVGFSVRQLLSSDALIYNQYNNIYFSKNELLHKTQFQFLAALNIKLTTSKTSSIYIGPQFSYSLSTLLKNNYNNNFHFITYGIQAGLLLHKK